MRVQPGQTVELTVDWGATGAVIGVRVLDNEGATVAPRVTGFTEYPAGSGLYYLDGYVVPDELGDFTLLYDDDGGTAAVGHIAVEQLLISGGAPDDIIPGDVFVDIAELWRVLKIPTPSPAQQDAGERVLQAAAEEIRHEIGLTEDDSLTAGEYQIAAEVNLERAVEHWRQQESPFGIIGLGAELGGTLTARDSWERHAYKLAPLKRTWGLA